jgi:hypothetical protein
MRFRVMPNTDNDDQISRKSKAKAPKNAFNGSVLKPINRKTPKYKINNQLGGKIVMHHLLPYVIIGIIRS